MKLILSCKRGERQSLDHTDWEVRYINRTEDSGIINEEEQKTTEAMEFMESAHACFGSPFIILCRWLPHSILELLQGRIYDDYDRSDDESYSKSFRAVFVREDQDGYRRKITIQYHDRDKNSPYEKSTTLSLDTPQTTKPSGTDKVLKVVKRYAAPIVGPILDGATGAPTGTSTVALQAGLDKIRSNISRSKPTLSFAERQEILWRKTWIYIADEMFNECGQSIARLIPRENGGGLFVDSSKPIGDPDFQDEYSC